MSVQNMRVLAGGLAMTALVAFGAGSADAAKLKTVVRTGKPDATISSTVSVPAGFETIYLSGTTAGGGPDHPATGDTEAQATATLEKIKATLGEMGLGLGDIVMMHAYLAVDPKLGKSDPMGWNKAFKKYFGTPEQPNKPSRTSITVGLGGPTTMIEIETIAVRKPK